MQPLHAFQCSHGLLLVLLSYLTSVLGAFAAVQAAVQIQPAEGRQRLAWIVAAAIALGGGGTWSMHFIAMTGCRLPFRVTYDPALTFASLLLAVVVAGAALHTVCRDPGSRTRLAVGGTFTGLAFAAMHYTGMAAMRMPARLTWRPLLVTASVLIAITAAVLALWLAFHLRTTWQRLGSAIVMAGAICGLHYAGMAAALFIPFDTSLAASPPVQAADELGFLVFGVTILVLALLLMECRIAGSRQSRQELQALATHLRQAQEAESARIAREVHDEIGQLLTALRLDLGRLEKRVASPHAREEAAGSLKSMTLMLDAAEDAVQRIIAELRPAILDSLGLEAAAEWYVQKFERRTGIRCRFRSTLGDTAVPAERSTALFRILQEALTNVARHAGASEVDIRLSVDKGAVVLSVSDNGRGIPQERLADSSSLGLLGMRERARSLHGDVFIRWRNSQGTSVEARVPLAPPPYRRSDGPGLSPGSL